jgi:hypothetical protein
MCTGKKEEVVLPTLLYARNVDVDKMNEEKLSQIDEDPKIYTAEDYANVYSDEGNYLVVDDTNLRKLLDLMEFCIIFLDIFKINNFLSVI